MYKKPCHISSAWWPQSPAQVESAGSGLLRDRLLWGSPVPSLTPHLRGTHSALFRQLALPCHPGITRQCYYDQVSHLEHSGFRVSFIWRGASPSDIPPCCHLSFRISSISVFPWLHCRQPHSTTRSLFPPIFLVRPADIFNCLQQISSILLPLALFGVVFVMKAFKYSN